MLLLSNLEDVFWAYWYIFTLYIISDIPYWCFSFFFIAILSSHFSPPLNSFSPLCPISLSLCCPSPDNIDSLQFDDIRWLLSPSWNNRFVQPPFQFPFLPPNPPSPHNHTSSELLLSPICHPILFTSWRLFFTYLPVYNPTDTVRCIGTTTSMSK